MTPERTDSTCSRTRRSRVPPLRRTKLALLQTQPGRSPETLLSSVSSSSEEWESPRDRTQPSRDRGSSRAGRRKWNPCIGDTAVCATSLGTPVQAPWVSLSLRMSGWWKREPGMREPQSEWRGDWAALSRHPPTHSPPDCPRTGMSFQLARDWRRVRTL